eukprot:6176150-Pleurochrysis_carterae.AAC.4
MPVRALNARHLRDRQRNLRALASPCVRVGGLVCRRRVRVRVCACARARSPMLELEQFLCFACGRAHGTHA